ncbi:alpha/beta hydrolase fold domain-containing protein [Actinomyces sp. 186855]|nr:alpha/beta hydrolase fold domain-containing protein [Actinomyces sp. AC-20-1]MCL3790786.1 alpha/beta hydrolase fold domain-containing protein [Actinomyces sp. 187325]MCL3792101.1 alpha/beta hydrolase fold domain-containing protein [Actinomyces sp. 186855]MCL3793862.1 alpha/beta hydrolase fold domain-containing protein [Actinomyces sp. 217892]
MDAWSAPFGEPEQTHAVTEDREIAGPHGPVPVRVYRPEPGWEPTAPAVPDGEGRLPGLVWLHGGAFVGGDLDMPEADLVARGITTRTGVTVVSVFYRLCHGGVHHPVPHDDGYAVFRWTVDNAASLGIDPGRVAVGGASAGGNLAAGVALHARDDARAGLVPAWQALLAYPVAHAGRWPEASAELAERLVRMPQILRFPADVMAGMNSSYLGGALDAAPAYASVGDAQGTAADLAGYPSTYIENCENDDLRASGEGLARQLADAGVDVECVTCAGVPHGHLNAVGSPLTSLSLDRFAARLRRRA